MIHISLFALFTLLLIGPSDCGDVSRYFDSSSSSSSSSSSDDDYRSCRKCFKNEDFYAGTYRIVKPGKYCLCENIAVNSRAGDVYDGPNKYGAWFPTNDYKFPGCVNHDDGGFALGFFAAISIETSNVELDLKGYELKMHRDYYIQQRFFNLIEVQNAPFVFSQGPANFGATVSTIKNVEIKNGRLGLTSHNGIHGFDVKDVTVENLKIYDFEVCGLQFNGFDGLTVEDVEVGPSATDVPFWAYYSHGRFALNAFELIRDKDRKYVNFRGGRKLTLHRIYKNLEDALDIAFRYEVGKQTEEDKSHPDYKMIMEIFANPFRVPDGSALYGMLFNSYGVAVNGLGDSPNDEKEYGRNLKLENIKIHDLYLNVNEIPALTFDQCDGYYHNKDGTTSITPVLDRFGGSFDCRRAMKYSEWNNIDRGFGDNNNGYSYDDVVYFGNAVADAQVALDIFSDTFESKWGMGGNDDGDKNRGKSYFTKWATEEGDREGLPKCARFICNGDAMFHTNKGVFGVRMDSIENAYIHNVEISNLFNESPLGSYACGDYEGPFDGANPRTMDRDGYGGTTVRGLSIINGGDADVCGDLSFDNLVSNYGAVIGVHLMNDAKLYFDKDSEVKMNDLKPGTSISREMYDRLKKDDKAPYPNNFYDCNIKAEDVYDRRYAAEPYDMNGHRRINDGKGYLYPNPPDGMGDVSCTNLYDDDYSNHRE